MSEKNWTNRKCPLTRGVVCPAVLLRDKIFLGYMLSGITSQEYLMTVCHVMMHQWLKDE
jgi:hypothetical protein